MKSILISLTIIGFLLSGCATNEGPEYSGHDYNQIKTFDIGVVTSQRPVVITDDGDGKLFGMIIGAVLGSTLGGGDGTTLTSLGGGIAGYYAGNEIAKANADELTVKLDNGSNIVVVVKGKHIETGDRVKIIKDGNKVAQVDKIQ